MAHPEDGQTIAPGQPVSSKKDEKTRVIPPEPQSASGNPPPDSSVSGIGSVAIQGPESGATLAPGAYLDDSLKGTAATPTIRSSQDSSVLEPNKARAQSSVPPKDVSDATLMIPGQGQPRQDWASDATLAPGSVDSVSPASPRESDATIPGNAGWTHGSGSVSPASSDATLAPGARIRDELSEATLAPGSVLGGYPESDATMAPGTITSDTFSDATLPPGGMIGRSPVDSDATLAPGGLSGSGFPDSDATLAPGSQYGSQSPDQTLAVGGGSSSSQGAGTQKQKPLAGSKTVPLGGAKSQSPTHRYGSFRGDNSESSIPAVDSKGNRLPVITGYELLGELGRGGMGVVYRARQKGLGRMVALKMVLNNQASQEELDRFMLEAQAVARVEHPNIVQIYDVGEYNMLPYFSLEFVDGGPLDKKLNGEPQEPMFTATVMAKLCRAMGYAHGKKILHRDLKPANVLMTKGGEPKITDFGLAKEMDAPDEGHTKAGSIMGTPSYMPPEQAEGKAKDLTNRADIYSLGAILYEFITGRPPFKGRTLLETLQHVRTKEPVPPNQLQPSVPPDLQTICLKALEKDPEKRYGSGEEMAEDLEAFVKGDPIKARPISNIEKAVRWAKRNKPQAALIGMAAAMVLLVITGGFVYLGMDAHFQRLRAERIEKINEDRREAEALLDESIRKGAANEWTEARNVALQAKAKLGDDEEVQEVRDKVEAQLALAESHLETDSRRAQFDQFVDDAFFASTDMTGKNPSANTQDVIDNTSKALELFEYKPGGRDFALKFTEHFDPEQRTRITSEAASLLLLFASRKLDQEARTGKPFDAVLDILEAAKAAGAGEKLLHLLKGRFYQAKANKGDQDSQAKADQEFEAQSKLVPQSAREWFLLGDDLYRRNDYLKAEEAFGESSRRNPRDFWSVYYQAICALKRESWPEAAALLQNCISRNPKLPSTQILMGIVRAKMGQKDRSEEAFARAKELGGESLNYLVNRGALLYDQDKYKEAEEALRKAVKIASDNWEALDNLGMVLRKLGKPNEALSTFRQAERFAEGELKPMRHLAATLAELDPPLWEEAANVNTRIIQKELNQGELAKDYVRLATNQFALKQVEEAKTSLEKSLKMDPENPSTWILYANVLNEWAAGQEAKLNQLGAVTANIDKKGVEGIYRKAIEAYDKAIDLTAQGKSDPLKVTALKDYFKTLNPEEPPEVLEARVYRSRGFIKARLGDYGSAMLDYTRSIQLNGEQPSLRIRRGTALISKWKDIALEDYTEAIRLNPNDLEAYAGRAYILAIKGDHAGAAKDAELVLKSPNRALGAQVNGACALAQAYRVAKEPPLGAKPAAKEVQDQYLDQLWKLIEKTMALVPEPQKARFWTENYLKDDSFDPIRDKTQWKDFSKKYGAS